VSSNRISLAFVVACCLTGCVAKVTADENERAPVAPPPLAEFDPQNKVIPFPNDLLIDTATGRLALPPACAESPAAAALRTGVLNALDGFGTSKTTITATFSQPVDAASLGSRVFVLRMATAGAPADGSEGAVPFTMAPGKTLRSSGDCQTSTLVDNVTLVPETPLRASSVYAVALLRGIETIGGAEFQPSPTWTLVRERTNPVELSANGVIQNRTPFDPADPVGRAALLGLDRLWNAHAPLLSFLDATLPQLVSSIPTPVDRREILLAWAFRTQTIAAPFQADVPNSPASLLTSAEASDAARITETVPADQVDAFYTSRVGPGSCAMLECSAIGAIHVGAFVSPNFQSGNDCRTDGTTPAGGPPGPWSDPIRPLPVCNESISFIAVVPKTAPPAAGYGTILFGHGLTRSKGDVLAIAGRLATRGIATIAIDAVAHGDRAKRTSNGLETGCAVAGMGNSCTTAILPTCAPQCYASLLSSNLATTRDNLRQTVLDSLKLERVVQGCATRGACESLWVDGTRVGYLGQSLGAILGGVFMPVSRGIRTGVFNVGAADWVQLFTYTESVSIRCPLLDALIDQGVLEGAKWNLGANPSALCLDPTGAWRQSPAFLAFASVARWILDPADGVNYAEPLRATGGPEILLQEVIGDAVVPNDATDPYGALLGLVKGPAAVATTAMPAPTLAAAMPGSAWIQYRTVPADVGQAFPGSTYSHGSLLAPATPDLAGLLGTAQMQTDAITFLVTHL
jgi:hypothetical protein